jgi:hypothetical protein
MNDVTQNVITDASGRRRTNSRTAQRTVSQKNLDTSFSRGLKDLLEPVIKILDQDHPAEMGHEFPSRKDSGIRILLNNFCRDVHQQIYGVKTDSYNFAGVKDSLDRAEASMQRIIAKYETNDDNADVGALSMMQGDPSALRSLTFYEVTVARMEMLSSMLSDLKDIYRDVTGEDWVYVAPGTAKPKANINVAAKLAAFKNARKSA